MKKYTTKKALAAAIDDLTPFTAVNEYGQLVYIELNANRSSDLNTNRNERFKQSSAWEQLNELFGKNEPKLFATRYTRSIVFTNINGGK